MPRQMSLRRWVGFVAATTVLSTGILLLSVQAADIGLAPRPDPDQESYQPGQTVRTGEDGSPVVDRLNTWAETKGKKNVSPAKGGGKNK